MSELLPCPFCGGEAHISMSSDGYGVECWNRRCIDMQIEELPTEAEAIQAWNTRATPKSSEATPKERTCENVNGACSSCGAIMYDAPNYCPNCGAKVVGE